MTVANELMFETPKAIQAPLYLFVIEHLLCSEAIPLLRTML